MTDQTVNLDGELFKLEGERIVPIPAAIPAQERWAQRARGLVMELDGMTDSYREELVQRFALEVVKFVDSERAEAMKEIVELVERKQREAVEREQASHYRTVY